MSEGKHLVGVDIGSSSIKVVELKEGRRGARTIVRFAYHPLPPQTIVDGHIINSAAVVDGLEKLFHKQRNRDVALRVSGHSVIIKKITMPVMTAAELREQINWEAEQHIPFDLTEVEIDWQVLQRREDQGQMDVLLVAAKKEEITDLTNLAIEAKLRPRVVDLDAFTVQNAYIAGYGPLPQDKTIALIHVGASLTTLNILSRGTTAFTRDIANGGNQITEEIQRALGISAEEAEAYKCGGDGRGLVPREVPDIVNQVVEQLAGEIQRSLDFYLATSGEDEVHRVVISGGTANIRALQQAVEQRARVPVELLDPLQVGTPDPKVDSALLAARSAQAAVAMGLGLRREREKPAEGAVVRINLMPMGKRAQRAAGGGAGGTTPWFVAYAACAIVMIVGLGLLYVSKTRQLEELVQQNNARQHDIERLQEQSANIDEVRAQLDASMELEAVVAELQRARFGPTRVLMELSTILSRGGQPTIDRQRLEELRRRDPRAGASPSWDIHRLWISEFEEQERQVRIVGRGRTHDDVAEFLQRLQISDYFTDVQLQRTAAEEDSETHIDVIEFEVRCAVSY